MKVLNGDDRVMTWWENSFVENHFNQNRKTTKVWNETSTVLWSATVNIPWSNLDEIRIVNEFKRFP